MADLGLRLASALVLIPLAIGTAYLGGYAFLTLWSLAAIVILWEWGGLVSAGRRALLTGLGIAGLLAGLAAVALRGAEMAPIAVVLTAVIAAIVVRERRAWSAGGILYAGGLVLAAALLRADPVHGLTAILFLFALVWSTDVAAYFGGRWIGGPKLWARVSPKKTWSGAAVGTGAGIIAGVAIAWMAGLPRLGAIAVVALALSVASQAGDLLESAVKRHFGAKDAGHLIPGHGGLMDRLDGFVGAALVALVIGVARAGIHAPARGLLLW